MASGGDAASAVGVTGTTHARPAVVGVVGANGLFGRWLVGLFGAVCPEAEVLCVDASATEQDKRDFVTRCALTAVVDATARETVNRNMEGGIS